MYNSVQIVCHTSLSSSIDLPITPMQREFVSILWTEKWVCISVIESFFPLSTVSILFSLACYLPGKTVPNYEYFLCNLHKLPQCLTVNVPCCLYLSQEKKIKIKMLCMEYKCQISYICHGSAPFSV